jgi:hypothetical protein
MEFNSLNNITNKYPSGSRINPTASLSEAYTTDVDDNGNRIIVFSGVSDENKVIINVESSSINLKDIKVVDDTSLNFVIEYIFSDDIKNSEFYTSKEYYDKLLKAKEESNPYYSTYLLEPEITRLVIKYEDIRRKISDNIEKESKKGIEFEKKHAFKIDASNNIEVDLEFYTKYIDWATSSDSNLDINSIKNIAEYKIDESKIQTGSISSDGDEISKSIATVISNIIADRIRGVTNTVAELKKNFENLTNQ